MKSVPAFILVFVSVFNYAFAQSPAELEAQIKRTTDKRTKLNLCYQFAEKYKRNQAAKSADYALQAAQLAVELGDRRKEGESLYLSADALKSSNPRLAAERFIQAWNAARNHGLRDVALGSSEKLQELAHNRNDLKEELKWSRELVNYLKDNSGGGRGGGEAVNRLQEELSRLRLDNQRLSEQIRQLSGQSQTIETTYQTQIKEVQEKTQQEISQKAAELEKTQRAMLRSDSVIQLKTRLVANLTAEQMADSIVRVQQERELAEQKELLAVTELGRTRDKALRNVLALLSGFVLILAGLFYVRYRAKRRTAEELTHKNSEIEAEKRRSDNLLLNILPPAIAEELKTRNKVAARKYDQATVMFIDFAKFTYVAERLSPELLVEELDYCFSNFDQIITKYRIEKIKTIGDAYMCASGLSDKASAGDVVRAALEIQDFMLHMKAERQHRGIPFFEARIGIHTGPVVAGVVGSKKFAYDIWGDTVNVAARMEETCDAGRVNVSEDTYDQARYEFEWQSRGKVSAKNKGMMEMFYVTGIKTY